MIVKSEEKKLLPCKLGLIKNRGRNDVVDVHAMRYGN